jgi:putative ubiquitin-RnfH superfamily antitoxin RatB of RatAB toxin-antitoxin module
MQDQEAEVAVTVVYALPERVWRVAVSLPAGSSVREAVRASGLAALLNEPGLLSAPVGIFGELRDPDSPVVTGDRVEIYRPLPVDPKQERRRRAEQAKR